MINYICKDCDHPIHWSRANAQWYHDSAADSLFCPGLGMVEPSIEQAEV